MGALHHGGALEYLVLKASGHPRKPSPVGAMDHGEVRPPPVDPSADHAAGQDKVRHERVTSRQRTGCEGEGEDILHTSEASPRVAGHRVGGAAAVKGTPWAIRDRGDGHAGNGHRSIPRQRCAEHPNGVAPRCQRARHGKHKGTGDRVGGVGITRGEHPDLHGSGGCIQQGIQREAVRVRCRAMFQRILIANRGEIAARIARTCKRMGVATVGIHSEADVGAFHTTTVDQSVLVGPAAPRESYMNVSAILDAARATGAQAVHPGYGLLSEKVHFARAVQQAGLTWIGPPPAALEGLGDKMLARATARAAGVPLVPGSDGPVTSLDEARAALAVTGLPALVKAVGGGGGIGMQIVRDEAGLERAVQSCSDRAAQAFGDPRVYIERYVEGPHHVEVQIFGDAHGTVVALGERECSLQRRHQKIVEESPAPILCGPRGQQQRTAMLDAAVRVGMAAGYVGAGTCEFIWDDARQEFYFLEVNCRIQVEHPVTEMVTGLDLVEHQLRVASGEPLPRALREVSPTGHAVEARIYAEDPARGFIPKPGDVRALHWPEGEGIRVDAGVHAPGKVTPYYDPMIAKIVAWAPDRAGALARLIEALGHTTVAPLVTNLVFLRAVLASDEVSAGRYDTSFAEVFAKRK